MSSSQGTKLLEATVKQLKRPEVGLRGLAEAVAGGQTLKDLGRKGYASAVKHTAAWFLQKSSHGKFVGGREDLELVARMHICALAREVQERPGWSRAARNPEVAPSAYELAKLTAESSRSYLRWAEELRMLRTAAARRSNDAGLTATEGEVLDGLLSDDFNVTLLVYLGRAALHESFEAVRA